MARTDPLLRILRDKHIDLGHKRDSSTKRADVVAWHVAQEQVGELWDELAREGLVDARPAGET